MKALIRSGHWLVRPWRSRPRLLTALATGAAIGTLMPSAWMDTAVTRALVGWNVAVVLYLVLAGVMMWRSDHDDMRERARIEDEGRWVVLLLFCAVLAASLVAIALELGVARQLQGGMAKAGHIALAAFTVLSSWLFMQLMFALHYAHEFYGERGSRQGGGLSFPGTPEPVYGDFLYMACSIGTSGQTADVAFTSAPMRRIGTLHCALAFFFNTTILALTINIAAGLL